jgi:hypothetical protein
MILEGVIARANFWLGSHQVIWRPFAIWFDEFEEIVHSIILPILFVLNRIQLHILQKQHRNLSYSTTERLAISMVKMIGPIEAYHMESQLLESLKFFTNFLEFLSRACNLK